jgi:outer membrane receptor protein involved in Fe transport
VRSLALTIGLSYDNLLYPTNYRNPPLLDAETRTDRFSPKFGVIWKPWADGVLRAAYTRSLGGVSLEDSVRLEPTLVGGFNQALRTLVPESITGTVDAARDNRLNVGFEQKIGSGTYLAVEANHLKSDVDRSVGLFEATLENSPFGPVAVPPIIPTAANQTLHYEEKSLLFTANQLLGGGWSLGTIYTLNDASIDVAFPELVAAARPSDQESLRAKTSVSRSALLHEGRFFALYNDPSGWFARAEALWVSQDNDGYPARGAVTANGIQLVSPANGADFWQINVYAGYRLPRNTGDITVGLLNLTGRDYRLNPLNEYAELPRSFTVSVQTRLNF